MSESHQKQERPNQIVEVGAASDVDDVHADIFFTAVETTRMPMIITDPRQDDNPIIFANHAFLQMTGYRSEEIVGRNCRFLQGPDTDRNVVSEVRSAVETRKEFSTEILNYRKDGTSFWNALFISPVHNRAGELVYFFASQLDVSRRRDAEQALAQAQKMEALGQLTGGIAHDFNNLLQVVSGYTDILLNMGERGEIDLNRHQRASQNIRTAADRAAKLTQQLLAFSRKQRLEGRPISLNSLVENMGEMLGRTLGDHVDIARKLDPALWSTRADPTQTEMAIINILVNARDAMPTGGTVTITTRNEVLTEEAARFAEGLTPGRYCVVDITDNGTGIPPEILPRIIEPFFTTKDEGKGTGLGLATVYGFMKQSGGGLRIDSEVGHWTRVRLFFPASDVEPQPEAKPRPRIEDRRGHEKILIVDDRPEVAESARAILDDFGYTTLIAYNGREALAVMEAEGKIDLLFTDLIMPGGMNGVMLAREARARQPSIKVLLTTGYAEASLERTDAGGGEFDVINKPYRRLDLIRMVRRVIDGYTHSG